MGQDWKKFKLLMWKNFLLQKRHKVQTLMEILIPLVFVVVLIIIRAIIATEKYDKETRNPPFHPLYDVAYSRMPYGKYVLYTSIEHKGDVNRMMKGVKVTFNQILAQLSQHHEEGDPEITGAYQFVECDDMEDLEKKYEEYGSKGAKKGQNENPVLAAVLFTVVNENVVNYTIRFPGSLHNPLAKNELGLKPHWLTDFLYELFPLPRDRDHIHHKEAKKTDKQTTAIKLHKQRGGNPGYWAEGFLTLQYCINHMLVFLPEITAAIDRANASANAANVTFNETTDAERIIAGVLLTANRYKVLLQQFPYPKFTDDIFIIALQLQLPVFIMLSFIYSFINIAKSLGYEKERRLKESMKIMGLDNWLHWCAWFTKSLIFLIISAWIIIILFKIPWFDGGRLAILTNARPLLLFCLFLCYLFATITLAFLVSVFSSSAGGAATSAGVVFFLTYFPYFFLQPRYNELSFGWKIGSSLLSNTAMAFGFQLVGMFEGNGDGLQWHTVWKPATLDDDLAVIHIMAMLVFDGVLYFVIAIYVEAVFPGEFGIPLPWYFPFTKWFWFDMPRSEGIEDSAIPILVKQNAREEEDNSDAFQAEPDAYAGIQIKGLTKIFGKKLAVNNLSINFYENQVTALLGHNGAGKTTTMSMITGLFSPTSGTAIVNGFDIITDMKAARCSLGLCPQHDVLYDELTVEEHLRFFCVLKGIEKDQVQTEINRTLSVIMLEKKRFAQTHTLSGGMKRKLSVGIALIGGSKVVLLDEPTGGMDPSARRSTWDLITNEKKGRTIVLSTHFMDEADLLGDRIAIMAEGQAKCCGSSLFLKKKFGGGYRLIIVKGPKCKVGEITELIQRRMPEVNIDQNIGAELSFSLPDDKSSTFPEMFEELEKRKEELGVDSFGCSITEMEEVFMRVGEKAERDRDRLEAGKKKKITATSPSKRDTISSLATTKIGSENDKIAKPDPGERIERASTTGSSVSDAENRFRNLKESTDLNTLGRNEGVILLLQQFRAMMVKKWLYTKRNLVLELFQLIIPVVYLIIALIMLKTLPTLTDLKFRAITLADYNRLRPVTLYKCKEDYSAPEAKFCDLFKDLITADSDFAEIGSSQSLENVILKRYNENIPEANIKYVVAMDAGNYPEIIGYFNSQPYHSPPLALNLIFNAILRNSTKNRKFKLLVNNHPMPLLEKEKVKNLLETENEGFHIGFNISFGMSFLVASFVILIIKERETKSKHLQFVSGVKFPIFWIAHYIFDVAAFVISVLVLMFTLLVSNQRDFSCYKENGKDKTNENCERGILLQGYFFIILLVYSISAIPLMYLFSFIFAVPSSGYTKLSFINFLTGCASILTMSILQLKAIGLSHVADKLEWFFMLFPNFDLGYAIGLITLNRKLHDACDGLLEQLADAFKKTEATVCAVEDLKDFPCCTQFKRDYLAWETPGIGRHLFYLFMIGIVSFLILFCIEAKIFSVINYHYEAKRFAQRTALVPAFKPDVEDADVAAENSRIRNTDLNELLKSENMILKDLTKYYKGFLAVNNLCLGIKNAECFGLLGVNGAGKTTTFKMLTGDIPITGGEAFIAHRSVRKSIKEVQKVIGYCPQFDALIPELTGRATIQLFARLRGVPEAQIPGLTEALGKALIFGQHMDKPCGTYSGGNKRKLSVSLALLGSPPLVFLDEPTTGMDPVARRHLWNAIIAVREGGASVVLTSHSMEECEALCTRLCIMVNGSFRCLGSGQHLKSKFGKGYVVIAQMATSFEDADLQRKLDEEQGRSSVEDRRNQWEKDLKPLQTFIEESFPDCELKESHPAYVNYRIKEAEGVTWSKIFGKMEEAKARFNLEAYSVGQTTLEQVFLSFTSEQK